MARRWRRELGAEQCRAQRVQEQIVIEFVTHADPQTAVVGTHHDPVGQQLLNEFCGVVHWNVEEIRVRASRHETEFAKFAGESFALSDLTRHVGR